MAFPLSSAGNTKIGCCPHGLPPGACPICSGMGGGGGASKKREMSWTECEMAGELIRAQMLARKQGVLTPSGDGKIPFQQPITPDFAQKLVSFTQNIQNLPLVISKPLTYVTNNIILPLATVIPKIIENVQNLTTKITEKLKDMAEKLTAVFGEVKNFIQKKISEGFKNIKKKFLSLFGIVDSKDADNTEEKIEEDKKIFEMKTHLHSFLNAMKEKLTKNNQKELENAD